MVGMTQQQLGDAVGIKFQQIQKYETGTNRVSASRLWDIGRVLDVPISFFFEGMSPDLSAEYNNRTEGDTKLPADVMADKEAAELIRSYYSIPSQQRRRLFDLARVLSDDGN